VRAGLPAKGSNAPGRIPETSLTAARQPLWDPAGWLEPPFRLQGKLLQPQKKGRQKPPHGFAEQGS